MKNKFHLIIALFLISLLLVSCSGAQEASPVVEESAPEVEEAAPVEEEVIEEAAEAEETTLLVGDMGFTMSQLEAMETLDVEYTGKDDTVTVYTGVLVMDLISEVGLEGGTAVFIASDGYEAEVALAELEGCVNCVVAFDDGGLRTVLPGFPRNVQVKGVVEIQVK